MSEATSNRAEESLARLEREFADTKKVLARMDSALRAFANDMLQLLPAYQEPGSLLPHQAQFYSQNGEDGMIAEIVRRIGPGNRVFLEIGSGDGKQNCTRLLLESGWTGFWVDGWAQAHEKVQRDFADHLQAGRLKMVCASVNKENLGSILDEMGVPEVVDVLSLDVDQNTSHLWRALPPRRARVACVEYNSAVPPSVVWEVPYVADKLWDGTSRYGAGLKVLEQIGEQQGLKLVGCDIRGTNALFAAADEVGDKFAGPFTAEHQFEPPRYELTQHRGHKVRG